MIKIKKTGLFLIAFIAIIFLQASPNLYAAELQLKGAKESVTSSSKPVLEQAPPSSVSGSKDDISSEVSSQKEGKKRIDFVPVAVVTGGNRGIGFEICRQLASRGVSVVLTARDQEKGVAAEKKLTSQGLSVRFHPLEVTNSESIKALSSFLEKNFGRLDVLINNAGIMSKAKDSIAGVTVELMRETFEVNTFAPFNLSRALSPLLKRSKVARIVNISTGMGQLSSDFMSNMFPAYSMSKTALNAVTRALAAEYRGSIAVNSVCPGWVKTDMGGEEALLTVVEGAAGPVWHALDASQELTGKFTRNKAEIPW